MPKLMFNITAISRCAVQYRTEKLAALGLKSCHSSYLLHIHHCPGTSQDQLARSIFINKSNVARQLAFLEEEGFVRRCPSPEDKRVTCLYLTEKAEALIPQIQEILCHWQENIAEDLTEEEREILVGMLGKLRVRAASMVD